MRFNTSPAQDQDIPLIHEMSVQCGLNTWTESDFYRELMRDEAILIVSKTQDGRFSGFIHGRLSTNPSTEPQAEIYNIATAPNCRRMGAATWLVMSFLEECRAKEIERVLLEVRKSNDAAIRFYQKMGFGALGVRKRFYSSPPEDAIAMSLVLQNRGRQQKRELDIQGKIGLTS